MATIAVYNISDLHDADKRSSEKLISDEDYLTYEMVNYCIITTIISLWGVVANVINIIVFYKQGFESTINISFMGLAISDWCSLITMLLCTVFMSPLSPLLDMLGAKIASLEVQYLFAGLPHICFVRITSWITVFITAERCLCITFPLSIKRLITQRRTTMIICSIYLLIILSFEPEYETLYYGWKFDKKTNRSVIGLLSRSNRNKTEGLTFILFGVLGFLSFIAVIIFTLTLVIQLNKNITWRQNARLEKHQTVSMSNRDRKTVTMVVIIAIVLIVCYTPGVAVSLITFCAPEISVTGREVNAFFTSWSFVVIFESFNASINIFLYYYMSSKYRQTFLNLFSFLTPEVESI